MENRRNFWKGIAIGVLAGGVVGTGAALLYAPKSGSETRHMLKDKFGDIKGKASAFGHCVAASVKGNKS